jgi:uncharacterized protein
MGLEGAGDARQNPDARPTTAADRIVAIDVLRGVALFGVMAINVVTEFRVSIFQQFLVDQVGGTVLDRIVLVILKVGIDLKALAVFSLLFGAGLAIQFDQLSTHPRRMALLVRRLLVLLLIGVAHLVLLWNGDILVEYAIAGLIALPLLAGPRRQCAMVGIGLLVLYVVLPPLAALPSKSWMTAAVAEATRIYATGSYAEMLAFRIHELSGILPLHINILPRTIGLMLIGAALWRARIIRPGTAGCRSWLWVAAIGIPLGGLMTLLHASGAMRGNWLALLSFERLATIILAFGYSAAILGVASQARWRSWLKWAQPIGRMAFTNYLAQSVIFGLIFYGYGFGFFGKLGVAAALAIGTTVYVLQVHFSSFWLQRFRFGPVEWLWRSAMYGVRQPFRLR